MQARIQSWMSHVWVRQASLLLKKDYILAKRNLRSSLISMLVPFIFVLFLVLLQYAFENNQQQGDLIKPVRESELNIISKIPRCVVGPNMDSCHTLAFTPQGDPDVQAIMDAIMLSNELSSTDVLAFDNGDDLDRYLLVNTNETQGAYHFFMQRDDNGDVQGVRYIVQYNQTVTTRRRKQYDPSQHVLPAMQKSADIEILKHVLGSDTNVDYNYYPFAHPEIEPLDVVAQSGPTFFFGALMFNFVIQLGRLVAEKELRLRTAMQLMGLKDSVYWTSSFLNAFFFNTVSVVTLIISGLIFQLDFFIKNDFGTYFFLFFLFGLSMAPAVLLLSVFVSKARTATVLGFGVFLVGSIIQGFSQLVFEENVDLIYRVIFSLLPFALLSKGMLDIGSFSDTKDSIGLRWADRNTYGDFFRLPEAYLWLILDAIIFIVLAVYLDKVLPNENGMREHPLYFLTKSYWFSSYNAAESDEIKSDNAHEPDEHSQLNIKDNDPDVQREIETVVNTNPDVPFKLVNLKKTFYGYSGCRHQPSKDFHAVRGLYLTIEAKTLFCLLGHNGAGKTTTINVLTGQMNPTDGDAFILGHSIRNNMSQIQQKMGFCPQYDVLWPQLTAREHLMLFAGFKDVPDERIAQEVEDRLQDVDLVTHADNLAGNFSGGMKRRLSVAVALTGDPGVVYLDEPTTGMDPVSRRKVWNLIERVKHDRVTILTTHSMEEADVLGDRIGIMKAGRFVCLGSSLHLKNRFGKGYRITLRTQKDVADVETFVVNNIPDVKILGTENSSVKFNVPRSALNALPGFFSKLETIKQSLGIFDVQLNLATLEEVFLQVGGLGDHDDRQGEQEKTIKNKRGKKWKKICIVILCVLLFVAILSAAFAPGDTETPDLETYDGTPLLSALATGVWSEILPAGETRCARGADYSYFVRRGDIENKIVIEFQGGGECWDASTCDSGIFGSGRYNATVVPERNALKFDKHSGLFNRSVNTLKDWTHISIPHCSADYFWGNTTNLYDAGLSVRHVGALNAKAALDWIFMRLDNVEEVVVAGWGAGGYGAALWSAHVADNYPSASLTLLIDSCTDIGEADDDADASDVLLSTSMMEWRNMAYSTWAIKSSPAIMDEITPIQNLSEALFTVETIISVVANFYANAAQDFRVGRINFNADIQQIENLQTKFIASDSGTSLIESSSTSNTLDTLNAGFESVYCNHLKSTEALLLEQMPSNTYFGFIANDNITGILNRERFFTSTGDSTSDGEVSFSTWFNALVNRDADLPQQVSSTPCIS